jgi:hypothetical protein
MDAPSNAIYRHEKEMNIRYYEQSFDLPRFAKDNIQSMSSVKHEQVRTKHVPIEAAMKYYRCNRGVNVVMYDGSIVCFCPQFYYGNRCQYHGDRLTFIYHVNFSRSNFAQSTDKTIVMKFLVLFMYNNEIIDSSLSDVRPAIEINAYTKKITHFIYSRINRILNERYERYFNRTHIIHEQPYTIRVEAYLNRAKEMPRLIGLWRYPIYFDYLPSFRLVKVLDFIEHSNTNDSNHTCSNNQCQQHEQCWPILNTKSDYVCLDVRSKQNNNGSHLSSRTCSNEFCSPDAFCRSNSYHVNNTQYQQAICICPTNKFGVRCYLDYDRCTRNPCENNGTCFSTSNLDRYVCICSSIYYGDHCQLQRTAIELHIDHNLEYQAMVVQYMKIGFVSLNLILVYQQSYLFLPRVLVFPFTERIVPEIIMIKVYNNMQPTIYIASVQLNMSSINRTTILADDHRCQSSSTLFLSRQGKHIQ